MRRSCQDTCLSFHHPPQVKGDAPDDVDLCHGVGSVLIPLCSKAVLFGVTWGHAQSQTGSRLQRREAARGSPFSSSTQTHTHTLKGNHTFTHLYRQTHTHTCCIKTQSQAHHKNGATRLHLYYLQCVPTLCTRSSTHTMYWLSLAKLTLSDSITGMHSKVLRVFNMWLHI